MAESPEVRPEIRTGISSQQGEARPNEVRPIEIRSPIKDRAGIGERCQHLYANDWFRRSVVGLVLAAAAILQYYLVNLPVADLSQTTKFSPAKVMAADEIVSFTNPQTEPGHFSFTYEQPAESQGQRMLLSVRFDHATLTDETLTQFATLGIHAPAQSRKQSQLLYRCPCRYSREPRLQTSHGIHPKRTGGIGSLPSVGI
jgi:hypothetical protein